MVRGHTWSGGMLDWEGMHGGGGHAWLGACVAEGSMCGWRLRTPPMYGWQVRGTHPTGMLSC